MRRLDAPQHNPSQPQRRPLSAASGPVDPREALGWGQRHHDHWLQRWIRSTEDLARLQYSHRMLDAVIDEIDGRDIRIGDQWLTDYASCNYLGLDLDEEIINAVPEYLAKWGTHPSWSRLLGSPILYEEIEAKLTELLGAEDTLVLPTITHIHMSVIPVLAGGGTLFLDSRAHKTIYDGCAMAEARGATVARFHHNDLDSSRRCSRERLAAPGHDPHRRRQQHDRQRAGPARLRRAGPRARRAALRRRRARLRRDRRALVRRARATTARAATASCATSARPTTTSSSSAGFSKAYSSLLAFLACPTPVKQVLKTAAPPYLYSGPSPVASLATVLEGLRVNDERGEQLRGKLHHLTWRVLDRLSELGVYTPNESGFPIVEIPLADPDSLDAVGDLLFDRGIYVTMAAYPLVPRNEVGFRIQLTSANTDEQVDHLCDVLGEVAERFKLQSSPAE